MFFMKFILSAFLSPWVQTEDPEHCCVEAQPEEVSARELNCRTTSWLGRAGELLLVSNKTKQNKTTIGINLTKEMKDLYAENYETLIK